MSWNYDFVFFLAVDTASPHRQNFIIRAMAKELKGKSKILCVERPICPLVTTVKYPNRLIRWLKGFAKGKYAHISKVTENVYTYTPFVFLHEQLATRISPLVRANRKLLSYEIENVLKRHEFDRQHLITWVYHPYQLEYIDLLPRGYLVYDCYDNFLASTTCGGESQLEPMRERERQIVEKADIVFSVSAEVVARQKRINPRTYFLPNAVDIEHFTLARSEDARIPDEMNKFPKPIIGYVGTINEKIDLRMIIEIAYSHPNWSIVFVGPCVPQNKGFLTSELLSQAKKAPNIHFLGSQPYENILQYLKAFDVCIVPYIINDSTQHFSPLKIYEYLAAGKPIVSTDLPQARSFGEIVRIARSSNEFSSEIEKSLREDNQQLIERRIQAVQGNSWRDRAAKIVDIIEHHLL